MRPVNLMAIWHIQSNLRNYFNSIFLYSPNRSCKAVRNLILLFPYIIVIMNEKYWFLSIFICLVFEIEYFIEFNFSIENIYLTTFVMCWKLTFLHSIIKTKNRNACMADNCGLELKKKTNPFFYSHNNEKIFKME